MATELSQLRPIKIRFASEEEEVKGFYALMISGMPVHCLPDNGYIINEVQCKVLSDKNIPYIKE